MTDGNKTILRMGICLLSAVIGGLFAFTTNAAESGALESWNFGSTAGWVRYDPLNNANAPMTNPTNCLEVVFGTLTMATPQVHIIRADMNASEGKFSGQYWSTGITNVNFRIYCATRVPDDLRLYFYNATSSNWWYCPLATPEVGTWVSYSVPMFYNAGWRLSGGTSGQFKRDLQSMAWIGIQIQRNSDIQSQTYRIDDFVLNGASKYKDKDGDGMNDLHEYIAGTDDANAESVFKVEILSTNLPNGRARTMLRWTSAPDRMYTVRRTSNLMEGFPENRGRVPGKPDKTQFEDEGSEDGKAYYYKVDVE